MMQRCVLFLLAVAVLSSHAFTVSSNSRIRQPQQQQTQNRRFMFSNDEIATKSLDKITSPIDAAKPLEVVSTAASTDELQPTTIRTSTPVDRPATIVRDMNTGKVREVNWVDPAMSANTNPLDMAWWAYILFGLPFVLLLNDFLHFIPEDGPLSYFLRF